MFVVLFRKVLCIAVDFLPTSPSWHLPSSDRFVSVEVTNLSDFVLRDHCISFRQLPCESRSMACGWCFRPMRLKRWRSYDGFDNSRALVPSGRARVRKSRSCSAKGLKTLCSKRSMSSGPSSAHRGLLPRWPACFSAGGARLRQNEAHHLCRLRSILHSSDAKHAGTDSRRFEHALSGRFRHKNAQDVSAKLLPGSA